MQLFELFAKYCIGAVFYIGGNDSMDTIAKLSAYGAAKGSEIRFIGVPKTIDNDLPVTDHTPGFGSAAKFIATSMQEIIRSRGYDAIHALDEGVQYMAVFAPNQLKASGKYLYSERNTGVFSPGNNDIRFREVHHGAPPPLPVTGV